MSEVRFTGRVIGGPHDGATITFDGELEPGRTADEIKSKVAELEFEGHKYRITNFDKDKQIATLTW